MSTPTDQNETEQSPEEIGARNYARMRETFLRESKPAMYRQMKADGTLAAHCRKIGEEAVEYVALLESQMRQNAPDETMARMEHFRSIPLVAQEIARTELVYA